MSTEDFYVEKNSQPKVLLGATTWWPLSAKLALAFLRHGCRVDAVCPPGHPLLFVRGINTIYPYRGLDSLGSLYEAIVSSDPDLMVPCDDGVVWQLHELHRTKPELRGLIERSLGAAANYETVASRAEFLDLAQELQVRVPLTKRVLADTDLKEWFSRPGISGTLKMDGTWGGNGVQIAHSLEKAAKALAEMREPWTVTKAWKRWLINHDPLAFWSWKNRRQPEITLQQFITGQPANTMMACWKGKVLALVTVKVLWAQGATGAATVVRLIDNAEIRTAAERIAERLQLSGFHGLDFILERETGDAYLIELNPRCTQLGHLPVGEQGDLAGALCSAFTGVPLPPNQMPITGDTIAFFPQSSRSEVTGSIQTGYKDVPWTEAGLVRELMRKSWPERQPLARVYHAMRPPKLEPPMPFEATAHATETPS